MTIIKKYFLHNKYKTYLLLLGMFFLFTSLILGMFIQSFFVFVFSIIGFALIIIFVGPLIFKFSRWLLRKLFYRVRNRIIVNYLLTGVLPLFLIIILFLFTMKIFMLQLSSSYLKQSIELEFSNLKKVAEIVHFSIDDTITKATSKKLKLILSNLEPEYSEINVAIFSQSHLTSPIWTYGKSSNKLPCLLNNQKEHRYYLGINKQVYLAYSLSKDKTFCNFPITISIPLRGKLLDKLARRFAGHIIFLVNLKSEQEKKVPNKGKNYTFTIGKHDNRNGTSINIDSQYLNKEIRKWGAKLPNSWDLFITYLVEDGNYYISKGLYHKIIIIGLVQTKYSFIIKTFIQGALPKRLDIKIGTAIFWALMILALIFGIIELIALIISLFLSHSITKVIAQLSKKAELISTGEFSYKINSKRKDQLGDLAKTFDKMSDSLQILLEEEREKERLERELSIAQEVQQHFFPDLLPEISGINLFGKCIPARVVSGDYYDFLAIKSHCLDFFIGDISGKGISAALLMASSQTFLNMEGVKAQNHSQPVSEIVSSFNNYLVEFSSSSKYSTLFYGRYNTETRVLTYCNAGHLPPFLIRNKQIFKLTKGGMVPGLFKGINYEEETIILEKEDLLVAFTDGFTEIFDEKEEEFGEQRLLEKILEHKTETLNNIYNEVVSTVNNWSFSEVQADDMTIIMINT